MRDHTLPFNNKTTTHTIIKISDFTGWEKQNNSKWSSILFQIISYPSIVTMIIFNPTEPIKEKKSQTQIILDPGNLKLQIWEHGPPNSASRQRPSLCFKSGGSWTFLYDYMADNFPFELIL